MKCSEIRQSLGVYWDLPEDDDLRTTIDAHIDSCASCREQFEMWQESARLIRYSGTAHAPTARESIRRRVMTRIYADETWRLPVPDKMYSISYRMRRNLTLVIAFCMTLFLFGLGMSLFYESSDFNSTADATFEYGLKPVATVSADSNTNSAPTKGMLQISMATASIKEPYMIRMGPIRSYPDYMVVLSLLGLTATLLIMNWLSRTRA